MKILPFRPTPPFAVVRRCWCYHQPTKYHFRRSAVVGVITNNTIPPAAVVRLFAVVGVITNQPNTTSAVPPLFPPLLVLSPTTQYHLQPLSNFSAVVGVRRCWCYHQQSNTTCKICNISLKSGTNTLDFPIIDV